MKKKIREEFIELYGVTVIEFHADWSGFTNPDYTGSYVDIQRGVSSEVGGENAVANIVDGDSSIAASFNFHSARDLSSTVNIILGQMELSSVGMQISVDPNVISSIVGDLENVIASWGRVDKKRIAEIIGRIEALVTR